MTQQRRYQFGEVYYSGRSATGKIMRGTLVNHQRDHLVFAPDLVESADGGETWKPAEGRVLSE